MISNEHSKLSFSQSSSPKLSNKKLIHSPNAETLQGKIENIARMLKDITSKIE